MVGSPPELSANAQNEAQAHTTHISVTMAAAGKKKGKRNISVITFGKSKRGF